MQAHTKDFSDISYSCHLQEEQCLPPCHEKVPLTIDISFDILSYVFACQARWARSNIMICINAAPKEMIDGKEKRTKRYNKLGSKAKQTEYFELTSDNIK